MRPPAPGLRAGAVLALLAAQVLPAAPAAAVPPSSRAFSYLELNYIALDVNTSERLTFVDAGMPDVTVAELKVSTKDGDGIDFGAGWQFYGPWHLFLDYTVSDQTLTTEGTVLNPDTMEQEPVRLRGDFDVTRGRIGVGYGRLFGPRLAVYGRVSYDAIDFDEISSGPRDASDTDDTGYGLEAGARVVVAGPIEAEGHVRYTSVGEVDVTRVDTFDDDVLVGLALRYRVGTHFALQAGVEAGEIDSWYLGGRVVF